MVWVVNTDCEDYLHVCMDSRLYPEPMGIRVRIRSFFIQVEFHQRAKAKLFSPLHSLHIVLCVWVQQPVLFIFRSNTHSSTWPFWRRGRVVIPRSPRPTWPWQCRSLPRSFLLSTSPAIKRNLRYVSWIEIYVPLYVCCYLSGCTFRRNAAYTLAGDDPKMSVTRHFGKWN